MARLKIISFPLSIWIMATCPQFIRLPIATAAAGISSEIVWKRLVETAQQITTGNSLSSCPLVIHFARFEEPFLRQLHQENSPKNAFPFRIICTHEIAIRLLPDLPRRGIRAIAGYFGHSMPELKRSTDHVIATAFIWKKLVGLLDTTCGVSGLHQLIDWLAATKPPGRSGRSFPMNPEVHLRLPDKPGIYRMLRAKKGDPLYIGKAKSLKQRVNSYFWQKTAHAEHILEMLTQARELDFTLTGSALEAAILEADEIKSLKPIDPARPKPMDPIDNSSVGPEVTLRLNGFETPHRWVSHEQTRWEVFDVDAQGEIDQPVIDVICTDQLTELSLPAGLLRPSTSYRWRATYYGSDSRTSPPRIWDYIEPE